MFIKLYKSIDGQWHYHEAWTGDGTITEHWGRVGDKGEQRDHKVPRGRSAVAVLEDVLLDAREDGYAELDDSQQVALVIEYPVEGIGRRRISTSGSPSRTAWTRSSAGPASATATAAASAPEPWK
jgi:hypothetical protein